MKLCCCARLVGDDRSFVFLICKNSRCLCELAKQIGFSPNAREIFNLEGQIASYMHLVCHNITFLNCTLSNLFNLAT